MALLLLLFCAGISVGVIFMAGWTFSQSAAAVILGDALLLATGERHADDVRRSSMAACITRPYQF